MMVPSGVWGIWKSLRASGVLNLEGPVAGLSPSLGLSFPTHTLCWGYPWVSCCRAPLPS